LQEKARAFKLDLDSAVEGGGLKIVRRAPVELNVDQLTAELVALLEASPVQRLVIDTIGEFEQSIVDERRRSNVMASLLELLRARGVTALLTREIGQIVASELNFVQSPLELLAENLILLRYVELKHELIRVVSVLKMRDSAHDSSIRQYRIDAEGVRVLPPAETGEHRLRGIAKQESEQRAKQKPALAAEGNDKP
jgi:circadian clock protein KaiC